MPHGLPGQGGGDLVRKTENEIEKKRGSKKRKSRWRERVPPSAPTCDQSIDREGLDEVSNARLPATADEHAAAEFRTGV